MASNVHHQTWTRVQVGLIGIAILLLAGFCFGQAAVSLSSKDGPPTTKLRVSGSGFTPYAQIDIYFDTQDQALAVANAAGAFSQIAVQAPASAVPGTHWVTVVERSGHLIKQEIFEVHVNWTEFHTQNMMRWNPYENVLNVDNVGSLLKKGSYTTGGSVGSSPAVVDGVVYVSSDDNNVYALQASNGALLWSYPVAEASSPAVANGVVYVGSYDHSVYALDARTGVKLWNYITDGVVFSSPTVANGTVYVDSLDSNVYALNASTGALLWKYTTTPGQYVNTSPAVADGAVYVGGGDGNVYAFNASNGHLLWQYTTDWYVYSSPAVANGVVYVGSCCNGIVYALNARTGSPLWSYTTGDNVDSSPAVANGVVYIGSHNGNVYALDAGTGAKLWSYATGGLVASSPAVANGVVYVGSWDYNGYALNASTGALLGKYRTGSEVFSSPAVVNGMIYVGSDDGRLYVFGLPRGLAKQAPKRPDAKALRPDFNLKVSQSAATPAGTD